MYLYILLFANWWTICCCRNHIYNFQRYTLSQYTHKIQPEWVENTKARCEWCVTVLGPHCTTYPTHRVAYSLLVQVRLRVRCLTRVFVFKKTVKKKTKDIIFIENFVSFNFSLRCFSSKVHSKRDTNEKMKMLTFWPLWIKAQWPGGAVGFGMLLSTLQTTSLQKINAVGIFFYRNIIFPY